MIKRPELFALRRYAKSGLSREVVQAYLQVLNVDSIRFNTDVRNPSLLKIVVPLLQFVESLPVYTRFTRRISNHAQKLRGAILNTREPIDLLYRAIPTALDIQPVQANEALDKRWKEELRTRLQEGLGELNNDFGHLNGEVQTAIMEAFGYKAGATELASFRKTVGKFIRPLIKTCRDIDLRPILGAFTSDLGDDIEWTQGIAGQVIKKPMDSWNDADIDPFLAQIIDVANRIISMHELIATSEGTDSPQSTVITSTGSDGIIKRKIIKVDKTTISNIRQKYSSVFDQPEQVRAALCAILFDSLKDSLKDRK
ncbi:MAG: hypothetical protein EHM12_09440 [Dehalococcoidia bacterium]|nr:MAG: hypothetical protein EHM12_09440 [Dehalococcoidia bacterium]